MSFGLNEVPDYQELQSNDEYYAQNSYSPGGYGTQESLVMDREREAVGHSLRHVNIAQIHMAERTYHTDSEFTVEGLPITLITVIAQVRSVMSQTTSNVYKLDDGSGEIEARHSVESKGSEDTYESQSTL